MCFVNVRFCGSSSCFCGQCGKVSDFSILSTNFLHSYDPYVVCQLFHRALAFKYSHRLVICPFQVFCRLFIRFFCFSEIFPIIEISLIHSMTSFHFSVVPRCSWFYQPNRKRIIRTRLKRHNFGIFRLVIFARRQPCCIFRTKICSKFYPFQVTEF